MWKTLIATQTNNPNMQLHVIFNPASGPGTIRDPNYVTEDGTGGPLVDLKNAGAKIYGYVATNYAVRSIDLVKADIDLYVDTLYPKLIDGFFLDEMSNDLANVGYYSGIDAYSKNKIAGAPVVGNPGVSGTQNPSGQSNFSIDDYGASVDVIMTFEQTAANYASLYSPPSWTSGSEAHLLHTAESEISSLIQDALVNDVNYLYITDDVLDNPWDALSSSWAALVEGSLASTTPAPTPGPPGFVPANLVRIKSNNGVHSDQDLTVLATEDQSGSANDWESYVEFTPEDNKYIGVFDYELPSDVKKNDVMSLRVEANYLGQEASNQKWTWYIRNFSTNQWVTLGDNTEAPDWTAWHHLDFELPDPSDYVTNLGKIQLQYDTKSSSDDSSDLDLLSVLVEVSPAAPSDAPAAAPVVPPSDAPAVPPSDAPVVPPTDAPVIPLTDAPVVPPTDAPVVSPTDAPLPPPPPVPEIWNPVPGTSWQLQLDGNIDTSIDVDMYDIDLFDVDQSVIDQLHDDGRIVICYFSAGTYENWRPDEKEFPSSVLGSNLDEWPGERWLDIRNLDVVGPIMKRRLDKAVSKNYDGVDPDNVDGYTNENGFNLTPNDQLVYNKWLAQEAHARGLSIGLKNAFDQVVDLVDHFDWALNEQCWQYDECDSLLPFITAGKAVFGVEYKGNPSNFCPQLNGKKFSWLKKKLNLKAFRIDCMRLTTRETDVYSALYFSSEAILPWVETRRWMTDY